MARMWKCDRCGLESQTALNGAYLRRASEPYSQGNSHDMCDRCYEELCDFINERTEKKNA